MDRTAITGLMVGLQGFHLAFLLLHDWVRLGRLNDVEAQRRTDPFSKRLVITLVTAAPFAALLLSSAQAVHAAAWPPGLLRWLWLAYGLLFLGELRAWCFAPNRTGPSATAALWTDPGLLARAQRHPPQYVARPAAPCHVRYAAVPGGDLVPVSR